MNIVHIAPCAPYNEGWSYQENILPKFQHRLGHNVTLIITNALHDKEGKIVVGENTDEVTPYGVRIIRRPSTHFFPKFKFSLAKMEVYDLLCELKADYIFFHSLCSITINQAVRYKKNINPKCILVQDNHHDYNIGMDPHNLIGYTIRAIHRCVVHHSISSVDRVYGVTPWRKQYAEEYYKVPKDKTDVLIMGADDDDMDFANHNEYRKAIRNKYGISDKEFLVVSGGRLVENKKIDKLMEACGDLEGVRLMLFGRVDEEVEERFNSLMSKYHNIIHIGWIKGTDCYKYFYAADLVCFPGQHSVLWEQACASKVPCLIKRWVGMDHVDVGGNTLLLDSVTPVTLRDAITKLRFTEEYQKMLSVAKSDKTDVFLYSEIARKSIDDFIK